MCCSYLKILILIVSGILLSDYALVASDGLGERSASLPVIQRRPTAMCWVKTGETLAVANSASGTLSLVNVLTGSVTETEVCKQPVAIAWIEKTQQLAVVNQADNELLLLEVENNKLLKKKRIEVGRGANRIVISDDQKILAVNSRWDRRVYLFQLTSQVEDAQELRLKFEPGEIIFSPDSSRLIVFDAFAGQYAIINKGELRIATIGDLGGHQIRGVAFLAPHRLLITHQILHESAATTGDNIAAGAVIENVTQEVDLHTAPNGELQLQPVLIKELGVPSNGAADPGAIKIDQTGQRFIALSGVNEVMISNSYGISRDRIEVGGRPVDLLIDENEQKLYCLNQFDQSVTVIDTELSSVERTISLGPQPISSSQSRGEELFYDASRSRFGWYSCHSCHVDGHTNGLLADTFGDDSAGAPKRVLSLLGGRDNNPWAWNGLMRSLHDQVLKSGISTMRGKGFTAKEANDLVAYLHTLQPPPPYQPPLNETDKRLVSLGKSLFNQQGCSDCHIPPLTYTSDTMFDVGLTDEHGTKKFNPPSLIGVGYRRSYFHDGRAKELYDVFDDYGHQLKESLSQKELAALIRFLKSL